MSVYDYKWKAFTPSNVAASVSSSAAYNAIFGPTLLTSIKGPHRVVYNTAFFFPRLLYYAISSGKSCFDLAIKHAKITGKLLAICLVLGYPFSAQTVSLIGFSLGT